MTSNRNLRLSLAALAVLALAADDAVQTITANGVSFDVPKTWKSSKPSTPRRLVQLQVEAAKGDKDPAELVVTGFPGGAGTVKANLERWRQQFEDKDGKPAKITSDTRKGKNVEVTFAETSGHYVAAIVPARPEKYDKPDWRLLGAIVVTPDTSYFFKMVGPDKTVKAAKPAFEAMIKTIAVEEK